MTFNISRQPLVPAFLTLVALSVAAIWGIDESAAPQSADRWQNIATAQAQADAERTAAAAATAQPGATAAAYEGIDTVQDSITCAQNSITPAQGGNAATQNSIATAQGGNAATQSGITTAESSPVSTQNSIATAQGGNAATQNSITPVQNGNAATQSGITTAESSSAATQNSIATAQGGNAATQNSIATAESSPVSTQNSITPAQDESASTQSGIAPSVVPAREGRNAWALRIFKQSREGLVIGMPAEALGHFQSQFPHWSGLIAGILVLFTGMCMGRITIRYNLYAVSTCLAIPLFGIVACGIPVDHNFLTAFTASALAALSVKNFARAFCNGYGFDAIFSATFYLGGLLLVFPAAIPLVLAFPLALMLFHRTLREAIVALAGLLVLPLLVCYVNWAVGGTFTAPLLRLTAESVAGTPFGLFRQMPIPILLMAGALLVLNLLALLIFLSDLYKVGTKPRIILSFNIGILFLSIVLLCGPAASSDAFALAAIPSAIMLPVLFVRIKHGLATVLYLLLLAGAFCGAILQ